MEIKYYDDMMILRTTVWKTTLSTLKNWVRVESKQYLIFCYSNGSIEVANKLTNETKFFWK